MVVVTPLRARPASGAPVRVLAVAAAATALHGLVPAGTAAQATTFIWGGNCIFRKTRHPREAWEFLKFISGKEGAEVTVAHNGADAVEALDEFGFVAMVALEIAELHEGCERRLARILGESADQSLRRAERDARQVHQP